MSKYRHRLYKSTTHYPAYDHTSFNLEIGNADIVEFHLSFHVKYRYADHGFWFGLRPEIEIRRHTDRLRELGLEMQKARRLFVCEKCGRKDWGQEGLRRPKGWEFIYTMDFCWHCVANNSYKELLTLDR